MVEITYYCRHVFVQEGSWQVGGWNALNLQRLEPHSICKVHGRESPLLGKEREDDRPSPRAVEGALVSSGFTEKVRRLAMFST